MKIKLAILEKDAGYLGRIVSVFSSKYADKFQIYSFTDQQIALSALESEKIDVFVSSDSFDIDASLLPKRCGFAYFVDSPDIDTVNEHHAICKFQKADLIYKQILSIYSENAGNVTGIKISDDECKIITFSSPCGGTGTSTVAAACALYYSAMGKKTLYLSLEDFGSAELYYSGEGQADMSDVIFSIKSKKANIVFKLESCVKQDMRGTYYFAAPKLALDMLELSNDERIQLISEIKNNGLYDCVVVDASFAADKYHFDLFKLSNRVVMVSDGSESANTKVSRAYAALKIMGQSFETDVTDKMALIYNRFSDKTCSVIEEFEVPNLGGTPVYAHATVDQVVEQLKTNEMFGRI